MSDTNKRAEKLRMETLRNLNTLTRIVQDLDRDTHARDLKNMEKAVKASIVSMEKLDREMRFHDPK